jgi:hypothetical protein
MSESETAQAGMVVWAPAKGPVELPVGSGDRMFVNAGDPAAHQPLQVELPVLVAIRAELLAAVVMVFIGKPDRNTVPRERPKLLDQPVIEFPVPLAGEKASMASLPVTNSARLRQVLSTV